MEKEPRKTVALTLPQSQYEQLKRLAAEHCYSLPGYIRQILKQHLQPERRDPSGSNPL